MHVIKSQHELVNYVGCLSLCESIRLSESVEKLSTLSQLRNHINVDIILNQIDYSDKIGMRLLSENLKLVLEELDKDVWPLNQFLVDDLHRKGLTTISVLTYFDNSKLSFSQGLPENIPALNIFDSLELSVVCGVSNLPSWTLWASVTTPWR